MPKRSIKRILKLIAAEIRCNCYLLWAGIARGECELNAYHKDDNRLSFIASVTGSIFKGTIQIRKVFWNEHEVQP